MSDKIDEAIYRTITGSDVHSQIADIVRKTINAELDPKNLADKIENKVKNCWEDMVLKMLGMDNCWGKWEIDHCNGRSSSLSNMIGGKAKDAVEEFLGRCADVLPKINIDDELVSSITKEYQQVVKRYLHKEIEARAKQDVKEFIENRLSEIIELQTNPEAEAVHVLREAIYQTEDEAVKEVLNESLKILEQKAFKKLE
jgi:hypothetical protein